MNANLRYETFGSISKEEILKTIDDQILPNTFVLENLEPFPGYHGENLPIDVKPDTVFIILSKQESTEKILRTGQFIKKSLNMDFDTGPARVFINNITYYGVRIRELSSYAPIVEIQKALVDEGFTLMKKKSFEGPGIIQIRKSFQLESYDENILKDLEDDKMFYLKISYHLSWYIFKGISQRVKNNFEFRNYDAALGYFFSKGIIDFVRIYCSNIDSIRLNSIRDKYIEEIRKYYQT